MSGVLLPFLRAAQAPSLLRQKHLTAWMCGSAPSCQGREFREVRNAAATEPCTWKPGLLAFFSPGPFSSTAAMLCI